MPYRQWLPAGLLAVGLLAAACGGAQGTGQTNSSASPAVTGQPTTGGQTAPLKTGKTSLGAVLVNSQGRTLYWFAIDTPTTSKCSGACLHVWPVVKGNPKPATGVTIPGTLGEIKRSDGILQATWNGHPLYTYFGDTAAGQTSGNNINSFGGVWHAVVLSGSGGASPSPTSGGGYGGGGGY